MRTVNIYLDSACGMIAADLPDCPYYDWFDSGKSPKAAAQQAISRAREH